MTFAIFRPDPDAGSNEPMRPHVDPQTVKDVVRLYLAATDGEGSVRARKDKLHVFSLFLAAFGNRKLGECRKGELRQWLKDQAKSRPLSGWSLYRWCRTIQRAFNWAVKEDGIIQVNPFVGVSFPVGKRGQPMSEDHYRAAMIAARGPFRHVLFFQRFSGARPGEMAALEWEQLSFENSLAVLHEHKTAHSTGEARLIRLHPKVVRLLQFLRKRQQRLGLVSKLVFLNSRKKAWTRNALVLRMMDIRERAGIPKGVKLYGLRHAYATKLAVSGASAAQIAELLGHRDIRMSQHYIHLAGKFPELVAAVEKALK